MLLVSYSMLLVIFVKSISHVCSPDVPVVIIMGNVRCVSWALSKIIILSSVFSVPKCVPVVPLMERVKHVKMVTSLINKINV